MSWTEVCALGRLTPDRGVTALVGGEPVAVFLLTDGELFAVSARDPFCGANVLGRGLIGSTGDEPYVASPMYKHRFRLRDGRCLDDPTVSVAAYPVQVAGGWVQVGAH